MCVQCDVHMRDSVARCVTPARHGCLKSLQCFLAPVYACVGDGQAKPWFASKTPRLLVKSDRFLIPAAGGVSASKCVGDRRMIEIGIAV